MSFKLEVVFSGLTLLCGAGLDGRTENCDRPGDNVEPAEDRLLIVNAEPANCTDPTDCTPEVVTKWDRLMYRNHLAILQWSPDVTPSFGNLPDAQHPTVHPGNQILLRDLVAAVGGEPCLKLEAKEPATNRGNAPQKVEPEPHLHAIYAEKKGPIIQGHPLPDPGGTGHVLQLDVVNSHLLEGDDDSDPTTSSFTLRPPSDRKDAVVAEFRLDADDWDISTPKGAFPPDLVSTSTPSPTKFGLIGPTDPATSCVPHLTDPKLSKKPGLAETLQFYLDDVTALLIKTCDGATTVLELALEAGSGSDTLRVEILNHALTPPPGSSVVNHVLWYYDLLNVSEGATLKTICEPLDGIGSVGGKWYCPKGI